MQNVTNLEITEGEVRTIHDSSDNLLWGRLNYDTKYTGDTFQQTYSGKNQLSYTLASLQSINTNGTWANNVYVYNGITYTVNDDLTINVNGSTVANAPSYFMINNSLSLVSSTSYILNGCPADGNVQSYSIRLYDSGAYTSDVGSGLSFTYGTQNLVRINIFGGITVTNKLFKPMIRLATVTDDTYEKFVGGISSPNPSYPQDIQVVTGEQTITISDGVNSEDFTVDLGSTELAKIGTYQDKIFQNVPESDLYNPSLDEGDWYVHKDIGKYTFVGNETGTVYAPTATYTEARFYGNIGDLALSSNYTTVSTKFSYLTDNRVAVLSGGGSNNWYIRVPLSYNVTTIEEMRALLANNTTYYALLTPTDTKITDATLISELEAIHEWLTRYGYTPTVSGNLPLVINQTNLT